MQVDLASLGTFNRIGTAGAERAADALSTLTGLETFVETTKINFAPVEDGASLFAEGERTVAIEFDGGLEGRALLVFDQASAEHVLSELGGTGDDPDPVYLNEVANIMTSSFVDGWAEHLSEIIDISTPEALDEAPTAIGDPTVASFTFVFQSDIEVGTESTCRFYLLPETKSFLETLEDAGEASAESDINVGELSTFIRLTAAGADTVATNLEAMTGIQTDVAISHLDFVPVEAIPGVMDADEYLGTVFQFSGAMDGYLAVLFEAESADLVAESLMPDAEAGDGFRRDAIEEIGNITASGFIDGWANALGTTIDHSVPDFIDDMGRAVLQSIAVELGMDQQFAYVFDVTVTADDPVTCRVFAFPEEAGFTEVVSGLDEDLDVSTVERI